MHFFILAFFGPKGDSAGNFGENWDANHKTIGR